MLRHVMLVRLPNGVNKDQTVRLISCTALAVFFFAIAACAGTDSGKHALGVTDPPAATPNNTSTTSTTPAPVPPTGSSSSEPLPRAGDRILLDGRVSMQQATSLANLWPGNYEVEGNLAFTNNMDGNGTHALRIDWASFNGVCGDAGAHMRNYLPQPYSKHIIVSWKQRLGRTPTGGGVGNINSFQITNSGNGCDANAGRKELLVCRDNADGGCYDRMDYLWPGPAPVSPRVDNNNQNLNFQVLPGMQFDPQSHVGQTIVQTVELQAESSTGASDGIVRVWINGIKVIENTHARIGAEAFNRTELPSTFNSPAQAQSEYIWDVVAWAPQG